MIYTLTYIFLIYLIYFNYIKKNLLIISIDGNIGSGKTTLINFIKKKFKYNKNIIFLDEPIDEWLNIKDNENNNILHKFYENKTRYGYIFQNFAFITRAKLIKDTIDNYKISFYKLFYNKIIIFTERSVESDNKVFAKMLYDDNHISDIEFNIYNYWYERLYPDIKVNNIIYIKTNPDIAYQRILKRNRNEETNITQEYINNIHLYHENWLNNSTNNICTLNGNMNEECLELHYDKIKEFIEINL